MKPFTINEENSICKKKGEHAPTGVEGKWM